MAGLERGGLDCAVGMFPSGSPSLIVEGIADDDYVCVFRRDHPRLKEGFSLKQFLAAKHILVKQSFRQQAMVDAWLSLQGMEREIVVTVNASADALNVAMNSDLVAAVPRSYVLSANQPQRLAWAPLPFPPRSHPLQDGLAPQPDRSKSFDDLVERHRGDSVRRAFDYSSTRGEALENSDPSDVQ